MTHADTWRIAMRRARTLEPDRIAAAIVASADTGLRASRYDSDGVRTSRIPCHEHETCEDGPDPHSHHVTNDPTGNAATRGRRDDTGTADLRRLDAAVLTMIRHAGIVLEWVCGEDPDNWAGVVATNAKLMPGTVQAGLDVDDDYRLPPAIAAVARAVDVVERIASDHLPRTASQDEQHWTAGLADEDCCQWHLEVHRRYRRPRVGAFRGERICADCMTLVLVGDDRPPAWLIEAEVDRLGKPRPWQVALGRWIDELGERSA